MTYEITPPLSNFQADFLVSEEGAKDRGVRPWEHPDGCFQSRQFRLV